jgi:hypothetical protein
MTRGTILLLSRPERFLRANERRPTISDPDMRPAKIEAGRLRAARLVGLTPVTSGASATREG